MRRRRQSNRREVCPCCLEILSNRLAATSHYRKHTREGLLEQRGPEMAEWRVLSSAHALYDTLVSLHADFGWFRSGAPYRGHSLEDRERARGRWLGETCRRYIHRG